jgi:hypothetical protein
MYIQHVVQIYRQNIKKIVFSIFFICLIICLGLNIYFFPKSNNLFLLSLTEILCIVGFRYLCLLICILSKYYLSSIALSLLFIFAEIANIVFIHYKNFTVFYLLNLLLPLLILWVLILRFIKRQKTQ